MKFKKILSLALALILANVFTSPAAANEVTVRQTTPYTAAILGTNLWMADIPTSILMTDKYSGYLRFPITAIAPYSVLADKAFGVDVEFELWTVGGKKLGDETIYSFSWNPVSSQTQVEMYLRAEDMKGSAVLRVRTEQTFATTGLISRYQETVQNFNITLAQGTPPAAPTLNWSRWSNGIANFTITVPASSYPITSYEIMVRQILSDNLDPTKGASYGEPLLLKSQTSTNVQIAPIELQQIPGLLDRKYIIFNVRAVSEIGRGEMGFGVYSESKNYLPASSPSSTPTPTPKPSAAGPKVYKNCTTLNKDYKGGVAKSAKSKNKGKATKFKPLVNSNLYEINRKLDTDKDGIVCEK